MTKKFGTEPQRDQPTISRCGQIRTAAKRRRPILLLAIFAAAINAILASAASAALPVKGENGVFRLTVLSLRFTGNYGGTSAPADKQFAVLSTRWENRIDAKLASERGIATNYMVPHLSEHLFLGIDTVSTGQLREDLRNDAGAAALTSLSLPKIGAVTTGDVVFEIPAGAPSNVELRFLDDTAGYLSLTLSGTPTAPKFVFPTQRNAVVELGVFAWENPAKNIQAPAGFSAVAVDLRGRSVWTEKGPAPDYAPDASATVQRLNLLNWPEAHRYIHLVIDGAYAYGPDESSTFPTAPLFVPDFFNGGRLIFFVPNDAKSFELECEMPHAAAPGGGTMDLPAMHFQLGGTATPLADQKPIVTTRDNMFAVAITAAKCTPSFAGENAGEGKQFLVLDATVKNDGETGEFFVPADQLLALDADDSEVNIDDITHRSPHHPEAQIHFPPHATRRFEVVYRIDASVTKPRLSFHGESSMQAYDLTPSSP